MLAIERLQWLRSDRLAKGDYTFLARQVTVGVVLEFRTFFKTARRTSRVGVRLFMPTLMPLSTAAVFFCLGCVSGSHSLDVLCDNVRSRCKN